MADEVDFSQYSIDELKAIARNAAPTPGSAMTPVPIAPTVDQLMTPITGPTIAPSPIELGVAQMRTRSPLEQALADLQGRRLLAQEAYSVGILPKVEAGAEAAKALLFGRSPLEQFAQETERQDILKEFVRQKDLEKDQLLLGMTGPELGGALLSPVGRLYTPSIVAKGAPLASALATRGANIAKAAGTGAGAAALQTFLSTPGTVEERLTKAEEIAGPAALIAGAPSAIGETISAAGPKLIDLGKSARRSAIGAKLGDYKKGIGKRQIDIDPDTGARSLTEKGLDNVIEKGYLGESLNPRKQQTLLETNVQQLENQLDAAISDIETQGIQVKAPSFQNIKDKIKRGKGYTVREQDKYLAEIADIEAKLNQRGEGKLSYLQEQKKAFGATYDPKSNSSEAMFNRDIYHALQAEVEKYVPQAKQINQEVQSLLLTRPIVANRVAEESDIFRQIASRVGKAGFTTGGIFGAGAAGLIGAGPAAVLGTLGAALGSKPVQDVIGQTLQRPQVLADALSRAGIRVAAATRPDIAPMFQEEVTPEPDTDQIDFSQYSIDELKAIARGAEKASVPAAPTQPATKQNISTLIAEQPPIIQAIIKTESAGKPKAVSSKGAQGLMQLMPATAKELGVDPTDPVQNIEGGTRYFNQMKDQFKDTKLALAAYNWGPGNLKKAQAKVEAKGQKPTWDNILKYVSVPSETEKYVQKVFTAEKGITRIGSELLQKYDDVDLAKIASYVGSDKLDTVLQKYYTGKKFTVGQVLKDLGLSAQEVGVRANSILQAAPELIKA